MSITSSHPTEIDETHPCVITIEGEGGKIEFRGAWASDVATVSFGLPVATLTWQEIRDLTDALALLNHVITR